MQTFSNVQKVVLDTNTSGAFILSVVEAGQKLYVRLFGRKYNWILKSKVKYPRIAEDLTETLDELVAAKLIDDGKNCSFISIFKPTRPVRSAFCRAPGCYSYIPNVCVMETYFSESSMDDLEAILTVMPAPELQNFAKSLKLNLKSTVKRHVVEAILKHSKQKHIGAFFKKSVDTGAVILRRYVG